MAEYIQVTVGSNWGNGDPMDAPTSFGFLGIVCSIVLPEGFRQGLFSIGWQNAFLSELVSACIEL